MISCFRIEPIFKKIIFRISIIILAIYIISFYSGYRQFNSIHKEQIKSFQQVVGILVNSYPEKENEIIESIFNSNNIEARKIGEEVLNKYGYNLETSMANDPTFKEYRKGYMLRNSGFTILIIIINLLILIFISNYAYKYLQKISVILEGFIKGNFSNKGEFNDEGVVNIISTQLDELARIVTQNNNKLEKEKEESKALVTDISHQLKTPLSSLVLCNSLLKEEDLTNEEKKEFLESSEYNINKLKSLIESLVNISRLEVAMIKIVPENRNIKDTIIRAINNVYIKAERKNIELVLDNIYNYEITHDPKWTEEAIFNVLDNGVKYSGNNEKIEITMSENINYIKIEIKDNGLGISKDEFNNIFKRFYRGKNIDKLQIEGSGVGLYLTRKILEEQGGNIIVKSKEGGGTTFSLFLQKHE